MPVLASQSRYNRFRGLGCMFYRLRFVGAVYRDLFCLYDIIVLVNPNSLFALGLSSYSGRDKNRLDEQETYKGCYANDKTPNLVQLCVFIKYASYKTDDYSRNNPLHCFSSSLSVSWSIRLRCSSMMLVSF